MMRRTNGRSPCGDDVASKNRAFITENGSAVEANLEAIGRCLERAPSCVSAWRATRASCGCGVSRLVGRPSVTWAVQWDADTWHFRIPLHLLLSPLRLPLSASPLLSLLSIILGLPLGHSIFHLSTLSLSLSASLSSPLTIRSPLAAHGLSSLTVTVAATLLFTRSTSQSCASAVTLPGKSQRPLSVRSEACVPLMLRECCDIARKVPASSFRML
ncbi:hypothetical protein Sjap_001973 [Stephania japonica]|uniref:Uncharacterized protein n=1 Tax=Stephania japonica TaxID=461633 RepID=A0AAP0PS23_9MAGN